MTSCSSLLLFDSLHPRAQDYVPFINDKVLHFVCFFFATALFYVIWDVDEVSGADLIFSQKRSAFDLCDNLSFTIFYLSSLILKSARRIWFWRHAALYFSFITCFAVGGIGSEIVQSLLPYKTFQIGDVIANLAGSALGLFFSYHAEARYRTRREIERLYQPLDVEDYGDGDFDLEDEEDEEAAFGGTSFQNQSQNSSQRTTTSSTVPLGSSNQKSQGQSNKNKDRRVRFEESNEDTSKPKKEDLFSIEDDDSDDEETGKGNVEDETTDAWRTESSSSSDPLNASQK